MKFVWLHFYPVLYLSVNDRLSVSTSQHTQRTMELLLNACQPGTQSHWTAVREVVPQFCSKAVQPTFWHSALEMTTEIQNSLYTQVHCPPFSWPFSPSVSGLLYGLWLCDSLYIHFKACHVDAPAFLFVECSKKKKCSDLTDKMQVDSGVKFDEAVLSLTWLIIFCSHGSRYNMWTMAWWRTSQWSMCTLSCCLKMFLSCVCPASCTASTL